MKFSRSKSVLFLTVLFFLFNNINAQDSQRPIGANLTDLSPFGTLWIYTNALKQSSGWLVENVNDEEDPINFSSDITSILPVPLDANGYPTHVPFTIDHFEQTEGKMLRAGCTVLNGQPAPWFYPSGDYLLLFEGTGRVLVQGDVDGESIEFIDAGEYMVPVSNPTNFGLILKIAESSISDPIHNVQLIFPEYTSTYQTAKFRQDFIDLVEPFHALRFMKPARTEDNTIENWEDRTSTAQFSYFFDTRHDILVGMPYEDIFELSNLAGFDPWIPLPYRVNDDYIEEFATLLNTELSSERKAYIEYSNEAWNPSYPETRAYMLAQGNALGLATSSIPEVAEGEAVHRFYAKRMFEVFEILNANIDNPDQLIKVHGSQSDPYVADLVLEAFGLESVNPNDQLPDALAPASYIGVYMFNDLAEQGLNVCDHTAEELLDTLVARINREMAEALERYSEVTKELGIDLFAYEGGHHVTEINFQPMDPCAETLVAEMNRLPEMEDFICQLFDNWYNTYNGKLLMFFNLAERADPFGSFGLLESQWQSQDSSPKWLGMENCVFDRKVTDIKTENDNSDFIVFPNPVVESRFSIKTNYSEENGVSILDLSGNFILKNVPVRNREKMIPIPQNLKPGLYIVQVKASDRLLQQKIVVK